MTTTSPIDLALNAVYKLFSDFPPELEIKTYTDDSSSKLEELVKKLTNTDSFSVKLEKIVEKLSNEDDFLVKLEEIVEKLSSEDDFLIKLEKLVEKLINTSDNESSIILENLDKLIIKTNDFSIKLKELIEKTTNTDDNEFSIKLEELVKEINHHPVLIRMGSKESKKRQPYADLLQQTIKERHLGVSGSIHSIVADLIKSTLASAKKTEKLEGFSKSYDPKAGDIEIYIGADSTPNTQIATENRQKVSQSLLNWAQLESCLKAPTTSFSRLAGGIRPIVYVFDDYNNFIVNSHEEFYQLQTPTELAPKEVITDPIKGFYRRSSSSNAPDLQSAIRGFGRCLNTLSVAFDIKAPDIRFDGDRPNRYQIVTEKLNFQQLDRERNQIAAFIIDLEWLPCPHWIEAHPDDTDWGKRKSEEMGHIAIRLLTQHYPEIPCFVFTGLWSIEILQKSLAAGAAWCFQKPISHHIGNTNNPEEELNYFNLEKHLTEFAKRNYDTYEQLPNPCQLDTETNPDIVEKLDRKMSMKLHENDDRAKIFRKLIAGQFTADRVNPLQVLEGGKSGALATFFAQPTNNGEKEATRFVKVDSWLSTQTEYFAYQHIIRPRLNNHVAHIIQKPSVTSIDPSNSESIGAITSSLAGFPEDYSKLSTLKKIIDRYIDEPGGVELISNKIYTTLEMVLLPLYQNHTLDTYWMGEDFFPCYEGELIPINEIPDRVDRVVHASDIHTFKNSENQEILDTSALDNLQDQEMFWLKGWQIAWTEDWKTAEGTSHTKCVVLSSRLLRHQIRLKTTDIKDFERRFNGIWIKPNIGVELVAKLNNANDSMTWDRQKILKLSGHSTVRELTNSLKIQAVDNNENDLIIDPFDILKNKCIFQGRKAVRHGDLNPNNILYPKNDEVGFLIDFARTKNNELIAFDMAWMEVQLWNYYVFPRLIEIAKKTGEVPLRLHQILLLSLKSIDPTQQDLESWRFSNNLSSPLKNSFKIINSIRQFTIDKLTEISTEEQNYSLGISFLRHSRFNMHYDEDKDKDVKDKLEKIDINNKSKVMSFLAATYYLSKMPRCESN
jgi:Ternary complex associated domain 9